MASADTNPDLCVIGASEAGLAVCLGAVALGVSCCLVDDGEPDGLRNPDLALATLARAANHEDRESAWLSVARALARAAAERRHARFAALNIRILRGTARFLDPATLDCAGTRITARRFVIATGGCQPSWRLAESLGPGVRLSVADLCRVRTTPAAVLVVGGSAEAVAAAQSLARLGSRVTLAIDPLLPGFDPELATRLDPQLRRDGLSILDARLQLVRPRSGGASATFSNGATIDTPHLLLAEAPRPAVEALDPTQASLALCNGTLKLDASLRTSKPHIFAVGRAAGARSTAEGVAQAGHVLRAALTPVPGRLKPEAMPLVTATRPEIAQVGRLDGGAGTRVFRTPLSSPEPGAAGSLLKVVTDRRGRVIGAGLVGREVRDLLPFWSLAVSRGLTLADLGDVVPPSPSASESLRAIVVQDLARRLSSPWARHALRVMRRFV